jgi:hypothetical protein
VGLIRGHLRTGGKIIGFQTYIFLFGLCFTLSMSLFPITKGLRKLTKELLKEEFKVISGENFLLRFSKRKGAYRFS